MPRALRVSLLPLAVALSLAAAPAEAKHKDNSGVGACQQRVADQIQRDHPPSRGSTFERGVQREPFGNNAVTIRGHGRVRTAHGKNRAFAYSCVYNLRSGKLSKVRYSIR